MEDQTTRVLLVDDDQGDFEMIRVMLANAEHQTFKLDWVSSYEEAVDAFTQGDHDVYFLDYRLEDRTGLDLLKEARELGITAPIIMLTGRGSRTVDMEAMELGASDYLVKGLIDPDALERSIRHALEREKGNKAIQAMEAQKSHAPTGSQPAPAPPSEYTEPTSGAEHSSWTSMGVDVDDRSAMFRILFDSTRSGVAVVGLDGGIKRANPAFAELFGSGVPWAEGRPFLDLLGDSDREPMSLEFEALRNGKRDRFESARRYLRVDGTIFWAHTTTALVPVAGGGPGHLLILLEGVQNGD